MKLCKDPEERYVNYSGGYNLYSRYKLKEIEGAEYKWSDKDKFRVREFLKVKTLISKLMRELYE